MRCYSGDGLLNSAINNLNFEAHLPGMNFCGPGTRLKERLARGDQPVNKLDSLCLKHDLFYDREKETTKRHEADRILAEGALQRFKSRDASIGERVAALGVAGALKAKIKLGMGLKQPSYKLLMKRCLKAMEKSKRMSENTLKYIQDGINILRNHNILNQSISPTSTQRKVKKKSKPPKKKEIEKKLTENFNINNDNLENLQMETEFNRKRKIEENETDDRSLQAKKSRISSNNQQLRKVRLAARRRQQIEKTDTPLNLNTPLNLTQGQFKRKINEESDDNSSDNEPNHKFIKTE